MTSPGRSPGWARLPRTATRWPPGWLVLPGRLIVTETDRALTTPNLQKCGYSAILTAKNSPRGGPTTEETKLKTGSNMEDNKVENGWLSVGCWPAGPPAGGTAPGLGRRPAPGGSATTAAARPVAAVFELSHLHALVSKIYGSQGVDLWDLFRPVRRPPI